MQGKNFCLLAILLLALVYLPACANRNSSTLVHGFSGSGAGQTQTEQAKVINVKPEVVAIHDGRADKLRVGMLVPTNAILRSNESGSAELAFSNGTTMNISPNSEIALASVAPAVADSQKDGAARGLSRKLSSAIGGSRSQNSKQATIGVRALQ